VTGGKAGVGEELLPVSVLTGFLGSGKTTVLRRLLRQPEMARVAVIINEFGEIGLDHLLVESTDDDLVLLKNGCLCCSVRSDLVRALRSLYVRRAAGEIAPFDRTVIETSGLADPASIIQSLIRDPLLADCYRLDGVVATVDAALGSGTLDRQPEAIKQAALADRLLLTKSDLATPESMAALMVRLHGINPAAPILPISHGNVSAPTLLNLGFYNPVTKSVDARRWLDIEAYGADDHRHEDHREVGDQGHVHGDAGRHDDRIRSFCFVYERPLEWVKLASALQALIGARGADILRVKGVVNIEGRAAPVVIHGVQHLFHPAVVLERWPDADRRSRLVFITRDVERAAVAAALVGIETAV
jgi:G3E family GTPase